MDLNAGYDVFDEAHQQIGFFRKDFKASLLRSTFHIEGPGYAGTGQERSQASAHRCAGSRTSRSCPSTSTTRRPRASRCSASSGRAAVRDRYTVRVPDPRVDFRVAAAVAVAMDAMMGR